MVGEVTAVSTGVPKTSIGNIGDYAINTTHVSNKIYKKASDNAWKHVGSTAWNNSLPVVTVASGTTVSSGNNFVMNGITITQVAQHYQMLQQQLVQTL